MNASLLHLPVTLVIIETESYVLANNALRITLGQVSVAKVVVFTDQPELFGDFDCVLIKKIEKVDEYNHLLLQTVPDYVETDFFIVCQYDGFVLNGGQFSPHFFFYDYIGAPWGGREVHDVGNGGFSWRSKKLALAVRELTGGGPIGEPEDLFICRYHRSLLEDKFGCRFAPKAIAAHFAFELPIPPHPTFGFHGAFHLPQLYAGNLDFLLEHIPLRMFGEHPITHLFAQNLGAVSPSALEKYQELRTRWQGAGKP